MSEIKSAWEIAQAKAAKLGKLSAEEERQQKEEECRRIGTAIAQRYLSHWDPQNMQAELSRYPSEERLTIARTILDELAQTIDLSSQDMFERTAKGMLTLRPPEAQGTIEQIRELSQEYQQAVRKTSQEMEARVKEMLHQLRVSGSAIGGINVEANREWQQSLQELAQPFQERLEALKSELRRA
jgi:signal transduction histidine kinase